MKLRPHAGLEVIAVAVSNSLKATGIHAVLTGGACASLYTGGRYYSHDLDLILTGGASQRDLDVAMAAIGYHQAAGSYVNAEQDFIVEFPAGPLAIGRDTAIVPFRLRLPGGVIAALSPTDSTLDRLAAWIHWKDRQSFEVAVEISIVRRVNLSRIAAWCRVEGAEAQLESFLAARRTKLKQRRTTP